MSEGIETARTTLQDFWSRAVDIWLTGGWAMGAIAFIALVMFGLGLNVHLGLRATSFQAVPESDWRRWIEDGRRRRGHIGQLLDYVTRGRSLKEIGTLFEQLRAAETAPFERDLRVMKVCVSAAPLVGLLGTVTGMLATFGALSSGAGGEKTMEMVAAGISEALITTETGLVIALPGLFLQYQVSRRFEAYKAFLAHLETVVTQSFYRDRKERRSSQIQARARREVARTLQRRLQEQHATT